MTQRAKDASRLARVRRVFPGVVLLFVVAHFSHHLVTALPVPLLPFIRNEFSLDYTRAALVVSAFSVPYGISQLPSGWLSDRFGPRRLLLVGISGVALGGLVVGISAHYAVLLAGLALMGVLGGGYHPSAPILISSVVEPSRRGSALGLHMIGGSASYFLAPLVAAGLAASFGWRLPFIALAIPGFLLGLGFYVLLGRHQKAVAAKRTATSAAPPLQVRTTDWVRLISFIALSGCLAAASMAMLAFVPLYLVDAFDYPEARAAAIVSVFYSAGLWAAVAGGYVADRVGNVVVVVILALLSGPAMALLGVASSPAIVVAVILFLGVALYARAPASESFVLAESPPLKRSTILGVYYFGAMEGNGVLAPIVGYLIDRFGFTTAFQVSGVAMIAVALFCTLLILRSSRRRASVRSLLRGTDGRP
jgi:predicted MFS family arabinose efflux permease